MAKKEAAKAKAAAKKPTIRESRSSRATAARARLRVDGEGRGRHGAAGTEVKSLRNGRANLEDAYAEIDGGEIWLNGCDIPEYVQANRENHLPKRSRKLLLHRREIAKLDNKDERERDHADSPIDLFQEGDGEGRVSRWRKVARRSTSVRRSRNKMPSATSTARCAGAESSPDRIAVEPVHNARCSHCREGNDP